MPTFKNESELESYLSSVAHRAVFMASSETQRKMDDLLFEYYMGYAPIYYDRTMIFYDSLGERLTVNRGNSYINIIKSSRINTVSFT